MRTAGFVSLLPLKCQGCDTLSGQGNFVPLVLNQGGVIIMDMDSARGSMFGWRALALPAALWDLRSRY